MKIAYGNDHRGTGPKQRITNAITSMGHEVVDLGTNGTSSVDYTDYAILVGEAVASGKVDRGILVCATGHGMCITANKVHGIRAANCRDMVADCTTMPMSCAFQLI
jgi:ribose 5-phosphate isomerase B